MTKPAYRPPYEDVLQKLLDLFGKDGANLVMMHLATAFFGGDARYDAKRAVEMLQSLSPADLGVLAEQMKREFDSPTATSAAELLDSLDQDDDSKN